MRQTLAKWGAATMIAAGLLFGGAMINETFAQTPQPTQAQPSQPADERGPLLRDRPGRGQGRKAQPLRAALARQTIELTGLEREAVVDQLRAGQSLSQIAAANGSSEQAVIDATVARLDERLGQALANGRITADEKTALLDAARQRAPELMSQAGLELGGKGGKAGRGQLVKATAEVTGLTEEQVRAELEAGKSLAQIAQANGKTADDIVANLKAKADAQVEKLLERAREQINKVPGR